MKRKVTIVKVPQYQSGGYTPLSMPVPLDGNYSPELLSFLKKKDTVVIPLSSDNGKSYTATNDRMMQAPIMPEPIMMQKPLMMVTDKKTPTKVIGDLPTVEVTANRMHNPLEMYQNMLQLDFLSKGSKRDKAIEGIFTALSKMGKKNTLNKIKVGALGGEPDIVPPGNLSPLQTEKDEFVIHPNFDVTKKEKGGYSIEGYRKNSPDRNNPYNIIPSNNITMQNTPFPVLGIGSNGQQQMMYPGNNYNFKGSSYVTEIPMKKYQEGGPPLGQGLQKFEDYEPQKEDLLNIPQHALMELLTGKRKSPSEILYEDGALDSTKISNRILGTLFDLAIDPLNYISGPRNIGIKGEQLGLTTLGKYIQAGLTVDNIKDTYSGLAKGRSDKYKKIDPQNDKITKIENKQEGGEPDVVPQSELSPLQTEKGEFVIHPNYSVTKSAARLPHSKMNNEVTDTLMPQQTDENGQVVAPGAYVVSKDPLMAIPKKVAEQINLGIAPAYYSEDMHLPEAKELNFADKFFGKKKRMTPAEMTQSVLKKYPKAVRNESEDIFAANSNVSNKKARVMPLEIIKGLNDFMRDSQSTSAALNNPEEMFSDDIPMAQLGTEVKSGLSTTIEEEIARLKAAREAGIPAGVGTIPHALNAMAGITGAAFVGAQNPISKIYQPSASALQDKYQGLSTDVVRGVFDNAQATKNQAWNKAIASGQVRAQDATSMFSEDSMLNAKNQAVLGNMQRNQQLDNAYAGDVINWQNKAIEGQNQNTLFQNKHLSNMGTVLTDTLTNAGNIVKGVEEYKQAKEAGINSSLFDMAKSQEMLKMYEEMMKAKEVSNTTNPTTPSSPAVPTEIAPFKDKRGISNPMGMTGQTDIMNSSLYNSNVFEIDPETGLPRLKGKRYGGKIK